MKKATTMLIIAAASSLMLAAAPSTLRAESAVGTPNDASAYFPGSTSAYYDPQAGGTKYPGTFASAYDSSTPPEGSTCSSFMVSNMHLVLRLQKGNQPVAYFRKVAGPICFDDQISLMWEMLRVIETAVQSMYGCLPGYCPGFKVKSFTNFQYVSGSNSVDLAIAVQ